MIKSNAPEDYTCPICLGVNKSDSEKTLMRPTDIVYKDDLVTVFINSFFIEGNEGHAILVPNKHHESLYNLPAETGHRIFDVSKKIALATKTAYGTDGITIKQNNEPAGDQHAFHYHMHVCPRYIDDNFNSFQPSRKVLVDPAERAMYAEKLKVALASLNTSHQ